MHKTLNLVPAFLVAQWLLIHSLAGGERRPAPPDFSRFPTALGSWKLLREDPIPADVETQLRADRILSRTYWRHPAAGEVGVFVAWFQSQREGTRQPHSPKVCLPGAGWLPELMDTVTINAAERKCAVNRYVAANRGQKAVVLYWYQSRGRIVANEWEAKLWTILDALRERRTDTTLVRLVTWPPLGNIDAATADAVAFAGQLYPLLRD